MLLNVHCEHSATGVRTYRLVVRPSGREGAVATGEKASAASHLEPVGRVERSGTSAKPSPRASRTSDRAINVQN